MHVASSTRPVSTWQPSFELDGMPFLADTCIRVWEKGEGGRIAQTLAQDLLLPKDVSAFAEGTEESIRRRLQWHTIAVTSLSMCFHFHILPLLSYILFIAVHVIVIQLGHSASSYPEQAVKGIF